MEDIERETEAEAAVALVHAMAPEESVLLMRRATREDDSWSGQWSLPGGRRSGWPNAPHPPDRDLLDTALRELAEECGIGLERGQMAEALLERVARRRSPPYLTVAPFVFVIPQQLPVTLDPREAVQALWVPLALLRDRNQHKLGPVPGREPRILFPSVALEGAPLWGFTYRLLADWLGMRAEAALGPRAAQEVLDFLLTRSCAMESPWAGREAAVRGSIEADAVAAHFRGIDANLAINCLEVAPGAIRIWGPEWEEYRIEIRP